MNTLKHYYVSNTHESWGYVGEDGPVHLGSKHYAMRICEELNVKCVNLTDVCETAQSLDHEQPVKGGFIDFLLSGK